MIFGPLSNKVNLDLGLQYTYHLITTQEGLHAITSILHQAFEIPVFTV